MPTSRIQRWFIVSLGSSAERTYSHHGYECPRMFRNRARDIWELFLDIYVSDFELRGRQIFKLAILTISDTGSKGEREDTSGDAISKIMADAGGFEEVAREIVADETGLIAGRLTEWCDTGDIDLVVTTGGTGLGPRDVTPEATRQVIDLEVPGIAEAMRMEAWRITPFAMLRRSVVGARNGCLIVNLPGSPKGVAETLEVALRGISHALEMVKGWRTH